MEIIQKQPNLSGAYPPIQYASFLPEDCIELPSELDTTEFYKYNGFVTLEIKDKKVTKITPNIEAWEAWKTVPIEQLREQALQRIKGKCSAAIESGVVVDGKRYILTKYDGQNSLQNALVKAEKGENPIPFSAFGENKPSPYTPEQIKTIAKAADDWGIVNTTYYGYLKDWIARETDDTVLNSIEYGSALPDDLMQELATKLSQFGIDISKYSAMLGGKD